MGRPFYQRYREPAERCGRGACEPSVRGGMEIGMQGMYHLSRRQPFGRDDLRLEKREEKGEQRGQRDAYIGGDSSMQASGGYRGAPSGARVRRGAFPEQQGEMGGARRPARRQSIRDIHWPSGR